MPYIGGPRGPEKLVDLSQVTQPMRREARLELALSVCRVCCSVLPLNCPAQAPGSGQGLANGEQEKAEEGLPHGWAAVEVHRRGPRSGVKGRGRSGVPSKTTPASPLAQAG